MTTLAIVLTLMCLSVIGSIVGVCLVLLVAERFAKRRERK